MQLNFTPPTPPHTHSEPNLYDTNPGIWFMHSNLCYSFISKSQNYLRISLNF